MVVRCFTHILTQTISLSLFTEIGNTLYKKQDMSLKKLINSCNSTSTQIKSQQWSDIFKNQPIFLLYFCTVFLKAIFLKINIFPLDFQTFYEDLIKWIYRSILLAWQISTITTNYVKLLWTQERSRFKCIMKP